MKKTNLFDVLSWLLVLSTLASAFYFYDILPPKVVTHWNFQGVPDGYSSKAVGAFLVPALSVFMLILFYFLPKLDPKRKNYQEFLKDYKAIQLVIIFFFTALHFITNFGNKEFTEMVKSCLSCQGFYIPLTAVPSLITATIGFMFVIIGLYLKNIKPNWFVGIRTPWTLSNDEVWKQTHKYGGKVFVLSGLLFMSLGFLPDSWSLPMFILIIALILSSIVYSYLLYQKQKKQPKE